MSPLPMCPGCRALLDPGESICPYCGWDVGLTETRREGGVVERALRPLGGIVPVLLAANVLGAALVAVVQLAAARREPGGGGGAGDLLSALVGPSGSVVAMTGAVIPELVLDGGQAWRLFTSMFLHFGIIHIGVNMMSLWNIGKFVEGAFGSGKALALYLLTGLAGSAAGIGWYLLEGAAGWGQETFAGAGASGAICGYAGIIAALGFRIGGEEGKGLWKPMVKAVGFILALGILLRFQNMGFQLSNSAHAGGFFSGLGLGWICAFGIRAKGNRVAVRAWDAAAIVLSVLTVASGVAAGFFVRGLMG